MAWLAWYSLVVTIRFGLRALTWSRIANPLWLFVPFRIVETPLQALPGTRATGRMTIFRFVPITTAVLSLNMPSFSWPIRIALASA